MVAFHVGPSNWSTWSAVISLPCRLMLHSLDSISKLNRNGFSSGKIIMQYVAGCYWYLKRRLPLMRPLSDAMIDLLNVRTDETGQDKSILPKAVQDTKFAT